MSSLVQNERNNHITSTRNEHCICRADNVTIVTLYHTNDSLSYYVCRCNYCKEEWAEYWISYRYIFSAYICTSARARNSVGWVNLGQSIFSYRCIKNIEMEIEFNGRYRKQLCNRILGMTIGFPLAFMLTNFFRMRRRSNLPTR